MARKTNLKKTKEQSLLEEKEQEINYIKDRIRYINEPTYYFNIGDKVRYGKLKESIVEEILYDGKVYILKCIATDNNYGKPYDYETYRACAWHDIRPIINNDTDFTKENNIKLVFENSTINGLLNNYYHFGINMNPEYQRDYVWNMNDKECLLESIFENIDIGKFVLVDLNSKCYKNEYSYEILDGKQRLSTIIEFYENRFPYKSKYYNDLSERDKQKIKSHNISFAKVENMDKNIIMKYFVLLNKKGKIMDMEHIKKVEKMIEDN